MKCPNCKKKCAKSVCFPNAKRRDRQGWGYYYCMNPDCDVPWTKRVGTVR